MASIGEPFLVSSHTHSNRKLSPKKIFVTHSSHPSASDGYVTITARGDGIHVMDLSSLHPVMSHSLGPSTSFSCPAVSTFTSEPTCTTYAVIESSPDMEKPEDEGRTVWIWKESLRNPSVSKKDRMSVTMPARISWIYSLESPHLLLISQDGGLILTNLDGQIKQFLPSTTNSVLASFIFHKDCTFITEHRSSGRAVLVLVSRDEDGKGTKVDVFTIYTDEGAEEVRPMNLGTFEISVELETITSVTCSPSGHITVLTRSGSLHSYHLHYCSSLRLTELSPPVPLSPSTLPPARTRCLALTSSHVLLCTLAHPDSPLQLLIWDVAFSVVIAAHSFTVPSIQDMTLELVPGTPSIAFIVLSPHGQVQGRSMVFAVPYNVPVTSMVVNAVGRHSASAAYMSLPSTPSMDRLTSTQKVILTAMRGALAKSDHAAASAAFLNEVRQKNTDKMDGFLDEIFVREVMGLIWGRGKHGCKLLCPDVLEWLLEKRAVRKAVVDGQVLATEEGGMFKALIGSQHLILLLKSVESVPDLTELDIVLFLCSVLSATSPHMMEVDTVSVPRIEDALVACIRAPWSSAPLRLAMHRCMKDPEGVIRVFEVIVRWIEESSVGFAEDGNVNVPPLTQMVLFLQSLLDATYLSLLSYDPSHSLLRKLFQITQSKIEMISEEDGLRAPLGMFVRKSMEGDRKGKEKIGKAAEGRKKRKDRREAEWMVGAYRVEELVL